MTEILTQDKERLRPELQEILKSGIYVQRFTGDDLPFGVIKDNVYTHTLRASSLVFYFPIPKWLIPEVVNTVLLHDLPEIFNVTKNGGNSDITAPQKEKDPTLAQKVAKEEIKIAKTIFTRREQSLYLEFEKAGDFLKKDSNDIPSEAAVFSVLMDCVDANLTLHENLSTWSCTENYEPSLINPDRSITFAFRQYKIFQQRLSYHPSTDVQLFGIQILKMQMEAIRHYWGISLKRGISIPQSLHQYMFI